MTRYPKHDAALASAIADIGEHERPLGSNSGPRVKTYQAACWGNGTGWPWCVAFWLYHTLAAGLDMPYRGAGAYALFDWAKAHGWNRPLGEAIAGDAVVFNIGAGHVGMFKELRGQTVITVDGNTSDRVQQVTRPVGLVRGVVHVPEEPVPVPKPKGPVFEVVSSESGHKVVRFVGRDTTIGKKLPKFLKRHGAVTVRRRKRG